MNNSARPLSSLKSSDILEPEQIGCEEIPVAYCGGVYLVAKGRDHAGIYYTVRSDAWQGFKTARSLAGIRQTIWRHSEEA